METVCNKLEKSIVEVEVTFDAKEWKDAQTKALNKLAAKVNLPGFRKGKAPVNMIKSRIGKGAILEEATDIILNKNYASIITENNIQLVGQPQVEVTDLSEEVLKVKVLCPVMPEVKLGDYKGLEVKKTAVRVTKKEIDERIASYQNDFAELIVKEEGTVENGDTAIIDFEGFVDGVAFDGGKGENYSLEIGSGSFVPGFEDQLVGMAINETKDINITFPENYTPELASKDATFKVTVHEIKAKVLPEIDDELAKDVNIDGVETLEDLEKHVKEDIRTQKQNEADNKFEEELIDTLIANCEVELPDVMVENELDKMLNDMQQRLSSQGATLELYLQIMGKTAEEMRADLTEQAIKNVKYSLILTEIVKAENIEVSDEEVDAEMNEIATMYGKEVEEVKAILGSQIQYLKDDIAVKKALQLIKDNVK